MSSITISRSSAEVHFLEWVEMREQIWERRKAKILSYHEEDIIRWGKLGWFTRTFLLCDPNEEDIQNTIRYDRHFFDRQYEHEISEIRNLLSHTGTSITISDRHAFIFSANRS